MKFIILVETSLLIISSYSVCLLVISKLSPLWDRVWSFNWKKLVSPSPRDSLCQVWLKLAQWFWKRRFLKVVNLYFPNYLPFGKGVVLYLSKLICPSPRNTLCQVWLKLAQWFLRKRMWKNLQTEGQVIRKAQLSFDSSGKLKSRGPWATSDTWGKNAFNVILQFC